MHLKTLCLVSLWRLWHSSPSVACHYLYAPFLSGRTTSSSSALKLLSTGMNCLSCVFPVLILRQDAYFKHLNRGKDTFTRNSSRDSSQLYEERYKVLSLLNSNNYQPYLTSPLLFAQLAVDYVFCMTLLSLLRHASSSVAPNQLSFLSSGTDEDLCSQLDSASFEHFKPAPDK